MNQTIKIVVLSFLILSAISCKKYQAGCMDETAENFSSYAKVDDGSCMYYASSDIVISNWTYSDPYYYAVITWGALTQDVINRGSMSVFMEYNGGEIVELPFTASYDSGYASHWYYEAKVGQVTILRYDTDLVQPAPVGSVGFKLAASW